MVNTWYLEVGAVCVYVVCVCVCVCVCFDGCECVYTYICGAPFAKYLYVYCVYTYTQYMPICMLHTHIHQRIFGESALHYLGNGRSALAKRSGRFCCIHIACISLRVGLCCP
jgi:hypothetical protein